MGTLPANQDRPRWLNPKPGELMESVTTNEYLYELAGITKEERGALLRDCMDTAKKHLHAKIRKAFQFQGQIVYSRLLPDLLTQSRAIEHGITLSGLSKKDVPKIELQVTVNLPPFMLSPDIPPPPKDITPKDEDAT